MNHRMILRVLSRVSLTEAALLMVAACVALGYGEPVLLPYGVPVLLMLLCGVAMGRVKLRSREFFAREGYIAVSLSWIYLSVFGCLPFVFSGEIPSVVDAMFETVSGFTTTGSTLLTDVEALPRGLLFWRSLTHWIGGMGVLVFVVAVMPLAGNRSMHLMRAETPGPLTGKLVPRAKSSAAILYGIYCVMTLAQAILLAAGGMPLFDSIANAMSTAGTGGFAVRNESIMAYHSPYAEVVMTVFMMLFGVNFNLYFLLLIRRPKAVLKSEELRWYLGIYALATVVVVINILPDTRGFGEAMRLAAFQTASVMSSACFASTDYAQWRELSQSVLMLLMIIGACAGSTAGGFKISRVAILVKSIRREISRMVHPRAVSQVKFEGKTVDAETTHSVLVYLAVYVALLIAGTLLIAVDGADHTTTVTAAVSALNNAGPGLGRIGPLSNFGFFSPFAKGVLSLLMLIGRLEIFPMILLFSPSVWRHR